MAETITGTGPVLDGRAWFGHGTYYGGTFIVELFESREDPGHYHHLTHWGDKGYCDESKRPVEAGWLRDTLLPVMLRSEGLAVADLTWKEMDPTELPLSGRRAQRGA